VKMSHQDWETVTLKKTHAQKTRGMSQAQAITAGMRSGAVSTEKRFAAGENKNKGVAGGARRLEEHGAGEDDSFKIKTVDKSLSKAIAQARNAKKVCQCCIAQPLSSPSLFHPPTSVSLTSSLLLYTLYSLSLTPSRGSLLFPPDDAKAAGSGDQ